MKPEVAHTPPRSKYQQGINATLHTPRAACFWGLEEVWTWTFQRRYPYPDRLLHSKVTHNHLEGKRLQLSSDFLL